MVILVSKTSATAMMYMPIELTDGLFQLSTFGDGNVYSKLQATKTALSASEMTYIVSSGALNSTPTNYLYVHAVEDRTLISIFEQFCFSSVFSRVAKIGLNLCT